MLVPGLVPVAAVVGAAGVFASARLYIVPGRPAWNTPLTVVRFFATALALGPPLTGHVALGAAGGAVAVAATGLNWARLARRADQAWRGAVRLELRWFGPATAVRLAATAAGVGVGLAGGPAAVVFVALAVGEVLGRWLFFVTVVPLNMPGLVLAAAPRRAPRSEVTADGQAPRPRSGSGSALDHGGDRYTYVDQPGRGPVSASRAVDRWVRTTCGYCSVGCGMRIGVRDGRAVAVEGDPDHPVNRGRLCPKGLSEHQMLAAEGRLTVPHGRRPPGDRGTPRSTG